MSQKQRPKKAEKREKKPPKHPEAALYKQLRQRAQDAIEFKLREHFETEAANAGFSSSFGPLTDMALAGPGTMGARDPDARLARDARLDRIRHDRAIDTALRAIPASARVLRAAYGDERLPAEVYGADLYGPWAGVALLTEAAERGYGADTGKKRPQLGEWLRSARSKAHRPAIRQEADTMLREARACFQVAYDAAREELKAMRRGPKVQEPEAAPARKRRPQARTLPAANPQPLTAYLFGGL